MDGLLYTCTLPFSATSLVHVMPIITDWLAYLSGGGRSYINIRPTTRFVRISLPNMVRLDCVLLRIISWAIYSISLNEWLRYFYHFWFVLCVPRLRAEYIPVRLVIWIWVIASLSRFGRKFIRQGTRARDFIAASTKPHEEHDPRCCICILYVDMVIGVYGLVYLYRLKLPLFASRLSDVEVYCRAAYLFALFYTKVKKLPGNSVFYVG